MGLLVGGLAAAGHHTDALTVQEAELAMERRLGSSEKCILVVQGNLANTYQKLGRLEEAMCLRRDVYSGDLRLYGEEHRETLIDAYNYTNDLLRLKRFGEVKQLMRKNMPAARRVLGESNELTLRFRANYAEALYADPDATLDDLREAVTTLEDTARIGRRVLGNSHPTVRSIEFGLRESRAALRARETPGGA